MGEKKKTILPVYDFTQPIRITAYRGGAFSVVFYSLLVSVIAAAMVLILFWQNGKIVFTFTLPRTLIAFPLSILLVLSAELLRELKTYTSKLAAKPEWSIEELMELTGKNRKQTEAIISHVLESSFTVNAACIKNWDEIQNA